jgi:hypothetical protein
MHFRFKYFEKIKTFLALLIKVTIPVTNINAIWHVICINCCSHDSISSFQDLFTLQPVDTQEDLMGDTVVLAGPGNVKKRTSRHSTSIQWQVYRFAYYSTAKVLLCLLTPHPHPCRGD